MSAIGIGVLILIQSGLLFVLKNKAEVCKDAEWAPAEMKSRAIQRIQQHEKCEFRYIQKFEDKHLKILGIEKKKKKKQQRTGTDSEAEEHDEYSFNSDEDDMDYSIRSDFDDKIGGGYYDQFADGYGGGGMGGTNKESQMSGDESERSYRSGNSRSRRGGGSTMNRQSRGY